MPTIMRRAMQYLGRAPDDEYDDYADKPVSAGRLYAPPEPPEAHHAAVRPLPRDLEPPSGPVPAVRRPAVVRPITPRASNPKPYAVSPESFNEAQAVADKYMAGVPV